MLTLAQLKREAIESMECRGHKPGKWEQGSEWYKHIKAISCTKCGMTVSVNPRPQPNGIVISGEAVALNCNSKH